MPRPIRIEYEHAFYHVMNRGRGRQVIFHDERYYSAFLVSLEESVNRFDAVIHAYCLMGNHYHLLIETPNANLSRIMRHINGVYTQRYNRLKKTDGPLFRGRYKAILIDEQAYLLHLSRYIHRNPIEVTAPLVDQLKDYAWSSYPSYINQSVSPSWLTRELTYQMLGQHHRYSAYRDYVELGNDEEISVFYSKGNTSAVMGGQVFREDVYREREGEMAADVLRVAINPRPDVDIIIHVVASVFNVSAESIIKRVGGRPVRNDARKVAMYACQLVGNLSLKEIANIFQLAHVGSVSRQIFDARKMDGLGELMREVNKRLKAIQ